MGANDADHHRGYYRIKYRQEDRQEEERRFH